MGNSRWLRMGGFQTSYTGLERFDGFTFGHISSLRFVGKNRFAMVSPNLGSVKDKTRRMVGQIEMRSAREQ